MRWRVAQQLSSSVKWSDRLRYLRFLSTTADAGADPDSLTRNAATQVNAPPLFPWRHSSELLSRLDPSTPQGHVDVILPPNGQALMASVFFPLSFIEAFFIQGWKDELAHASAYAFVQGVVGLMSHTYQLPASRDDNLLHFAYPEGDKEGNDEESSDMITSKQAAQNMLGDDLIQLYQSAHESGRGQLQILLQLEITGYQFFDLFALPFVTREAVERDSSLLRDMRDHFRTMREAPARGFSQFSEYIEQQAMRSDGSLFTTLDLQVLVEVDEIFSVTDKNTGRVVQGDGKRRQVQHLVRLETTVETIPEENFPYVPTHKRNDWKIVDIDDLLGTPAWYRGLRGSDSP